MNRPDIHAPRAIEPALRIIDDFLESRVAEGATFEIGQSIQCSWMWFKVEEHRGRQAVFAPRFGAMPMEFEPDCSDALNLIASQQYVCDSFDVSCGWCSAMQAGIVVKDILECQAVFMNRTDEEDGRISGWYSGAEDSALDVNQPDNLELKSLWELSCLFPQAIEFFLLPVGWQVRLTGRPTVLRDFVPQPPRQGSYFAEKFSS